MSLITVVDQDDVILEYKERWTLNPNDRYRVSALWVTNSRWEILLVQRSRNKKHHPFLWWPAVAGTVEKNETYEQNIIKETAEEIGIENINPIISHKTKTESWFLHFTQYFSIVIDIPIEGFRIQESEAEGIRWISPSDLLDEIKNTSENFTPMFQEVALLFLSENK